MRRLFRRWKFLGGAFRRRRTRRRGAAKWRMMHPVSGKCCDRSGADSSAAIATTPRLLCRRVDQFEPGSQSVRASDMRPRGRERQKSALAVMSRMTRERHRVIRRHRAATSPIRVHRTLPVSDGTNARRIQSRSRFHPTTSAKFRRRINVFEKTWYHAFSSGSFCSRGIGFPT